MKRIDIDVLKKIEEVFGYFDIDQAFGSNEVYLRFEYWDRVDVNKLQEIVGQSVEEKADYDDDCGYKFCYSLK
jgi:hypothetical protein